MKSALLVEDIDSVAQSLAGSLTKVFPGIEVCFAPALADAIQHLNLATPDIILLDLGLPDGRGSNLLLHRALSDHTWVVITTIFDDDECLFEALRLGARGYLLKDDLGESFEQALAGILEGKPPLSAGIARRILQTFRPTSKEHNLSDREHKLLGLVARGYSVQRAANELGITYNTAASYLKNVYQKLEVGSRAEATRKAIDLGLV
ncbi:response regulator transcription factor [Cellvibrio sp. UBA7661]|uniref:response regulator transcription factor n=1 Tax=Cellvibrio sp. UBA7661 TaxID=1946311 RepID=UPI002F35B0F7